VNGSNSGIGEAIAVGVSREAVRPFFGDRRPRVRQEPFEKREKKSIVFDIPDIRWSSPTARHSIRTRLRPALALSRTRVE